MQPICHRCGGRKRFGGKKKFFTKFKPYPGACKTLKFTTSNEARNNFFLVHSCHYCDNALSHYSLSRNASQVSYGWVRPTTIKMWNGRFQTRLACHATIQIYNGFTQPLISTSLTYVDTQRVAVIFDDDSYFNLLTCLFSKLDFILLANTEQPKLFLLSLLLYLLPE